MNDFGEKMEERYKFLPRKKNDDNYDNRNEKRGITIHTRKEKEN